MMAISITCIDGYGFTDGTETKTSIFNVGSNMWMMEDISCESMTKCDSLSTIENKQCLLDILLCVFFLQN